MYVQDIVDFIMKSNRYNLALRNVGAKNLDLQLLIGVKPYPGIHKILAQITQITTWGSFLNLGHFI